VAKPVNHSPSATRQQLLHAAVKCFAERGYTATSVREIVDTARVSKPVLYYYFPDKAGLFQAVVDSAHDERYQLMQAAAARARSVAGKLEEILSEIFEYALRNRELMRLTFATAFANQGDAPAQCRCREKGKRNFEFIRSLIAQGQTAGELSSRYGSEELAMGIYGQLNSYVMVRLLAPECPLDREAARQIVRLFLGGAARPASRGAARQRSRKPAGSPRSRAPRTL
jgi:TetR/AcrR family transcriptional regulator